MKKTTIGELTNSRMMWGFNPSTIRIENEKGKGSYNTKKRKQDKLALKKQIKRGDIY